MAAAGWLTGAAAALRRPLVAGAVLLVVYAGLSFVNDPRGQLSSDSGGKVATLKVMAERGRLDPDIGYWAERWDPTGRVHPLSLTAPVGDRWIQVTTLPMLYAAYPLYRVGGYRLALLLPMLGGVLAALAARAMARRLTGGDGWGAYWLVGLTSPLLMYALDFWEHSVGLAAMAWAMVFLYDIVEQRRGWPAAAAAGVLFGVAATMRTEALVYGAVAVSGACLVQLVRHHRPVTAAVTGALAAAALTVVLLANGALEVATIGDSIRAERAGGAAGLAVSDVTAVAGLRLREAVAGAAGLFTGLGVGFLVSGVVVVALLAGALRHVARHGDLWRVRLTISALLLLYVARFAAGPGVLPGMAVAAPLAVAGFTLGWSRREARYLLGVAVVAMPIVWATQYPGSAVAFVGGRYILLSGLLFATVGIGSLVRLPLVARRALIGLAVVVSAYSLAFMSIRTHGYASANAELTERAEPVLLSRFVSLGRSAGPFYGERRWLTARNDADQRFAVGVLDRAGVDRFGLILAPNATARPVAGWREVGRDTVPLFSGGELTVVTYERL